MLSRWLTSACGAFGVLCIAGGLAVSYDGYADFSPVHQFISELGSTSNPRAGWINRGFSVGGVLTALFLGAVAVATRDAMRRAAAVGCVSATCLALVGLYPIHEVTPHLAAAGGATVCALVASLILLRARRTGPVAALVGVQLLTLFACAGVIGYILAGTDVTADRLFVGRAVRIAGVNPIAMAEWIFFASVLGLLLLVISDVVRSDER